MKFILVTLCICTISLTALSQKGAPKSYSPTPAVVVDRTALDSIAWYEKTANHNDSIMTKWQHKIDSVRAIDQEAPIGKYFDSAYVYYLRKMKLINKANVVRNRQPK